MGQVISETVTCSTYIKARAVVDYSGSSATAHIQYYHTYGGHTGYTGNFTYGAGGSSASGSWSNETVSTSWTTKMSIGFSISTSGGTYSVWCSGYSYNDFQVNVTIPSQAVAPNKPTVSAVVLGSNPSKAIEIAYGTSSFGTPSSGTVYLYGGTSSSPTTQLVSKNTTGTSSFVHNPPLVGNTKYYYRARAKNSSLWSSYSNEVNATTYPAAPTITVSSIDYKNVTLAIASPSQGSALPMEIFYTVDGGTAISAGTITPGNFNTVNLTFLPNTTHTVNAYIQTTAGASSVATATFKTELPFYGSVNGQTKEITKLYGSVNGQTKLVDHLYGSVPVNHLDSVTGTVVAGGAGNITAFDGDAFYAAASSGMDLTKEVDHLELVVSTASPIETEPSDSSLLTVNIYYSDSTYRRLARGTFSNIASTYGLTGSVVAYGTDIINLTGSYSTVYVSKLIF